MLSMLCVLPVLLPFVGSPTPGQDPPPEQRRFTPELMEHDLFELTEALERDHAGLLRYAERAEIDELFSVALFEVGEEHTALGLYRIVAVAHHNGLAVFVGEETGGGYDGNTSGFTRRETLPNSGIGVSVPRWMYTTANLGHGCRGRGVPVDHAVRPGVEDLASGRDAELERVLELVRSD